jgi:hypothetical protein
MPERRALRIELSHEQRQQLENGKPVYITDLQTAQRYVILRKDAYERTHRLVYNDSDWTADELRVRLARSSKGNGWEEVGMVAYDHYNGELGKRCP